MSYFESNCARCHGAYGSFYGEGFGKNLTDSKLRQVVHDMAAGPGNAPVTEPQLDALTAYHRSMINGKPFLIVNAVGRGTRWFAHVERRNDARVANQFTVGRRHGHSNGARLHLERETAAKVDWSKVEIIAKKGEAQTVLKPGESEYSHRQSLDKTESATAN
jgi:hypothetical protein